MKKLLTVAVVAAFAFPAASGADTITSNLGPAGEFFCCSAIIGARGAGVGNIAAATPFVTPSFADWGLTEIDLGIESWGGVNSAIVRLTDSVGGFPGVTIASWTLTGLPGLFGSAGLQPAQAITGITGITLAANTEYWLAVIAGTPNSEIGWRQRATGPQNLKADSLDGGATWSSYTLNADVAFAVQGTPQAIPEPSLALLLGAGLVGLKGFARRRVALAARASATP